MPESPYHIRVTAEEMDDFMAGRDATSRPQQAAATAERNPLWGSIPGLNAFGPAIVGQPTTGQANVPTASHRAWPLLPLLLMLVVAGLLGVWRLRGEPSESVANPVAALLAAPAPSPLSSSAPARMDATATTMTVWCDGQPHHLSNARQQAALRATIPDWPSRCFADYGWCAACQIAWTEAHP